MITAIVLARYPLTRIGLAKVVQRRGDVRVIGEAESITAARTLIAARPPRLLVTELSLDDGSGLDLALDVAQLDPTLRALILTDSEPRLQDASTLAKIGLVSVGQHSSLDAIARALQDALTSSPRWCARPRAEAAEGLSPREREVLAHLGRGRSTSETAAAMGLSVKTIETYRANLKTKLECETAPQLVRLAVRWVDGGGVAQSAPAPFDMRE